MCIRDRPWNADTYTGLMLAVTRAPLSVDALTAEVEASVRLSLIHISEPTRPY